MSAEEDPLWYDRAEPDERLGPSALILLGAFAVGEFLYSGIKRAFRFVTTAIALAFRDARA